MAKSKKKYTKIGAVIQGQYGEFVSLGNEKSTDLRYKTTVQIRVTDGEGKVVTQVKNGTLALIDPRTNPNLTDEQKAKIPASVLKELTIVETVE